MLVTALSPVIGYDKASAIASDVDRVVKPAAMVGDPRRDLAVAMTATTTLA